MLTCFQSRSVGLGKEKNPFTLPIIYRYLDHPASRLFTLPTELTRLPICFLFFRTYKLNIVVREKVTRQTCLFHVTTSRYTVLICINVAAKRSVVLQIVCKKCRQSGLVAICNACCNCLLASNGEWIHSPR